MLIFMTTLLLQLGDLNFLRKDMGKGYIKRLTNEEAAAPVMGKWYMYLSRYPVIKSQETWEGLTSM